MNAQLRLICASAVVVGVGFGLTTWAQDEKPAEGAAVFESDLDAALLALTEQEDDRDQPRERDGDRERDGERERDGDRERGERERDGDRERGDPDRERAGEREREGERDGDRERGERESARQREREDDRRDPEKVAQHEEFRRHVERMKAEIAELSEAGRRDEAQRVEAELREQIADFEREQRGRGEDREGNPREHLIEGIHLLHAAAEHFQAAGLEDVAHSLVQRARELGQHAEREGAEHHEREGRDAERAERGRREEIERHEDERHEHGERERAEHGDGRVDEPSRTTDGSDQ